MNEPVVPPAPARNLREVLDDFGFALRAYVVKVTAQVEDDHPETQALSAALLAPLVAWQSPPIDKSTDKFVVDGILRSPPPDDFTIPESAPDWSGILCRE